MLQLARINAALNAAGPILTFLSAGLASILVRQNVGNASAVIVLLAGAATAGAMATFRMRDAMLRSHSIAAALRDYFRPSVLSNARLRANVMAALDHRARLEEFITTRRGGSRRAALACRPAVDGLLLRMNCLARALAWLETNRQDDAPLSSEALEGHFERGFQRFEASVDELGKLITRLAATGEQEIRTPPDMMTACIENEIREIVIWLILFERLHAALDTQQILSSDEVIHERSDRQ
ncbi:MAG: hypothetical protein U1E67_18835 [Hyphomicrobiales bacterium]